MQQIQKISKTVSLYLFFGLLAYMPLHILLSTWLGSSFGQLEIFKVLKDVVLLIGAGAALMASLSKQWFRDIWSDKLIWVIALYAALTLVLAIFQGTEPRAETLGIVYNLRFLLFFIYGYLLTRLYSPVNLLRRAVKIVVSVGVIVALFGVIQYLFLPNDALMHLGYSRDNGVLPAFFIDDKPDLERVMSTVRDPNSYGSYLIIVIMLLVAFMSRQRSRHVRNMAIGGTLLAGLSLLFTFSRSAWLGFFAATVVFVLLYMLHRYGASKIWSKVKLPLIITLVVAMVGFAGLYASRDSYVVQNVVMYSDESTVMEDPNELRLRFWQESLDASVEQPLGHGPGTAGLASIQGSEVVLNENYYLQILYEVGVVGLFLFLVANVITARRLYRATKDQDNSRFAIALLAAMAGLVVTNCFVHIWSNEAVAYTFWGLAGLAATYTTRFKKD